jgi:hypothetical protein
VNRHTLLDSLDESNAKYDTIDGRHRLVGGNGAGVGMFRCDVVDADGKTALRKIPTSELRIDPDVQLASAYSEKRARDLMTNWDEQACGALLVTPIAANGRVPMSVARKAEIKLKYDRERRRVSTVESFRDAVLGGDPASVEIDDLATGLKWRIDKGKDNLSTPAVLYRIREEYGIAGLRNVLILAANWKGWDQATHGSWLDALAILAADGLFNASGRASAAVLDRLYSGPAPATVLSKATGQLAAKGLATSTSNATGPGAVAQVAARILKRKRARR